MPEHRTLSKKNKYYLPKETFLTVLHYCKQYPNWKKEMDNLVDQNRAIAYDKEKVTSSNTYDPTSTAAVRLSEITKKAELIEGVAHMVAGPLKIKGIPCGKDMYYDRRRRFYFELAARI